MIAILCCFGQAKYLVDEARDKNNRALDVSKWESVFPQDIPEQLNGYAFKFFPVFLRIDHVHKTHIIISPRCYD
jgi:hypothetical protein